MALIDLEGFDAFTNVTQARKSLTIPSPSNVTFETGRDDRGKALRLANSGAQYRISWNPTNDTYVVGFAFKFNPLTAVAIARVIGERTTELELELTGAGELTLQRGTFTTIDTTSGLGLTTDTWYYIEWKFKIDNATGLYDIKVNGASVMSGTNVDTKNSSSTGRTNGPNALQLLGRSGATFWDYDDVYVLNNAGGGVTDFLGDCIVEPVYPTGDGTTNDFTPLSGLTNYEMVDDGDNPDDGTTYVSSSTVNHSELYTHGGLQEQVDTIYGVRVDANMWVSSPGPRSVRCLLRSGAANYEGNEVGCAASYKYVSHVWENDPNTAAQWTESGVNNAEFGMTIES